MADSNEILATTRPDTDTNFKITISGHASFSRLADRAYVKLVVTDSDFDKKEVSNKVLSAAKAIEDQLEGIQVKYKKERTEQPQTDEDTSLPIAHWSKTSLTSVSRTEYLPNDEQKRKYTSTIDFDIRFRDFNALGDFTAKTSGLDHCEVESVEWYLLDRTKKDFECRLRRTAAADALAKAKDYCAVFCPDVNVVRIRPREFISESGTNVHALPGLRGGQRVARQAQANAFLSSYAAAEDADDHSLAFTPQECKMELTICVLFHVQ